MGAPRKMLQTVGDVAAFPAPLDAAFAGFVARKSARLPNLCFLLTMQLQIEQHLGCDLFERTSRGLVPTEEARMLELGTC
jgi:hypothetical protein